MKVDWYAKIEDYNLGKMPPLEKEQFEAALASDPALALAAHQHRLEWETMELLAENELRTQIRQGFNELPPGKNNAWVKTGKWAIILALVLVAVVALVILQGREKNFRGKDHSMPPVVQDSLQNRPFPPPADSFLKAPPDTPALQKKEGKKPGLRAIALSAYQPPESLSGMRGEMDDSLMLAIQAFDKKDYKQVLRLLAKLPGESRQEALSLRAHAHFLAGNYREAIGDFSLLFEGGVYRREAEWYGLLSNLAAGLPENEWMEKLGAIRQDAKNPYQKDAAALWEKLAN